MNWTMPRPVLQVIAALLGAAALAAFTVGAVTAPSRGRLPGERIDGVTGQPIVAQEATPFVDERLQGAPDPVALTEEEKAQLEAERAAKAEALALAKAEADKGAPAGPPPPVVVAQPPPEKLGETLQKPPPAPKYEEPLF